MGTLRLDPHLTPDELLQAARQLSRTELQRFVTQVVALRAQQQATSLPQAEADLLLTINAGLPPLLQARYTALKAKRKAETLTPKEHQALLRLTAQVEKLQAERIAALAELARLRQTTLTALLKQLGLRPAAYG